MRNRGARAPGLVRCSPGSRCSADASTDAVAGPVLGQETSCTPVLPYITYIQYCINVASQLRGTKVTSHRSSQSKGPRDLDDP